MWQRAPQGRNGTLLIRFKGPDPHTSVLPTKANGYSNCSLTSCALISMDHCPNPTPTYLTVLPQPHLALPCASAQFLHSSLPNRGWGWWWWFCPVLVLFNLFSGYVWFGDSKDHTKSMGPKAIIILIIIHSSYGRSPVHLHRADVACCCILKERKTPHFSERLVQFIEQTDGYCALTALPHHLGDRATTSIELGEEGGGRVPTTPLFHNLMGL